MSSDQTPPTDVPAPRWPAPIVTIIAEQDAGRAAAYDNQPTTVCPWRQTSQRDAFLQRMWLRGYRDGMRKMGAVADTTTS